MRKTIPPSPDDMKQRTRYGFLWFPKTLSLPDQELRERRFLEYSSWIEEWQDYHYNSTGDIYQRGEWQEIEWAEK